MNLKERLKISEVLGDEIVSVLEDLIDSVNEIKTQYAGHLADDTSHNSADTTNVLSIGDVDDLENR